MSTVCEVKSSPRPGADLSLLLRQITMQVTSRLGSKITQTLRFTGLKLENIFNVEEDQLTMSSWIAV